MRPNTRQAYTWKRVAALAGTVGVVSRSAVGEGRTTCERHHSGKRRNTVAPPMLKKDSAANAYCMKLGMMKVGVTIWPWSRCLIKTV